MRSRRDPNSAFKHHLRILSPKEEEEGKLRGGFFLLLKLLLAVAFFCLIGYGVLRLRDDVVSNYDYFKLSTVSFEGDGEIDQDDALVVIDCAEDQYLLNYSSKKAQQTLTNLPDVIQAEVTIVLPDELVINIREHQPIAKLVDERGQVLSLVDETGACFPVTERQEAVLSQLPGIMASGELDLKSFEEAPSAECLQAIQVMVALNKRALKLRLKTLTMVNAYSYELTCLHQGLNLKVVFPFDEHDKAVDKFLEVMELSHRQLDLKEIVLLGDDQTIISVY